MAKRFRLFKKGFFNLFYDALKNRLFEPTGEADDTSVSQTQYNFSYHFKLLRYCLSRCDDEPKIDGKAKTNKRNSLEFIVNTFAKLKKFG